MPAPPRGTPRKRSSPAPADLRERILATSEALLESEGVAALSLREVARRAGVTHQAPYHHFADRESILAELVTQGFDELARRLAQANDRFGRADPSTTGKAGQEPVSGDGRQVALAGAGEAYVGFAIDHPGVFRIMFRPDVCDPTRFPQAIAAGERAYGELERMVRLLHDGQQNDLLASVYWSQVHGLACLIVDGPIGQKLTGVTERRAFLKASFAQFADLVLGLTGLAPRGI